MTPYQISFLVDVWTLHNIEDWYVCFAIDRLIDLVFFLDIIVNFRTAWVLPSGELVFDQKEAASNYFRFWFWVDFISVLPYEFLSLVPGMREDDGAGNNMRAPKLLRLLRLVKIAKILRASAIFKRIEQNMKTKYGVMRLFAFSVAVVMFCHWLACLLKLASTFSDPDDPTWVDALPESQRDTLFKQYVAGEWVATAPTGPDAYQFCDLCPAVLFRTNPITSLLLGDDDDDDGGIW